MARCWSSTTILLLKRSYAARFQYRRLKVTPELKSVVRKDEPQSDEDKYIRHNPASGTFAYGRSGSCLARCCWGINALTTGIKAYSAYRTGKAIGDGIRDPQTARDRGGMGLGRITGDLMDGRKEPTNGPTLRSPYHQ